MKKILFGLMAILFGTSIFAADVKGEVDNLKWLLRNGEMSIIGTNESKDDLTSITVPSTIEGKTVTKIFKDAFKVCKNLVEVNLPDTITIIDQGAFDGCKSLTEVQLPKSLVTIGNNAFADCSLTEVVIPPSVKTIGSGAFKCNTLQEIKIADAPVEIGKNAFEGCQSIEVVSLPDSIDEDDLYDIVPDVHEDCIFNVRWGVKYDTW